MEFNPKTKQMNKIGKGLSINSEGVLNSYDFFNIVTFDFDLAMIRILISKIIVVIRFSLKQKIGIARLQNCRMDNVIYAIII